MRDWVNEHFQQHKQWPFPRIFCADGTLNLSVQAGDAMYSTPRAKASWYSHVEVGFPSVPVEALMPYIEISSDEPTQTVYPYVPVDVVNAVIEQHGGIKVTQ